MMPVATTDYREEIRSRFLMAVRMILAARVNGVKTISQLAPMIGSLQQNISQMENSAPGEGRFPTLEQVARICKTFNFSAEWMMLGKGNMENTAELNDKVAVHEDRLDRIELAIEKLVKKK
ncbi:hypothetical protein ACLOAU_14375 [Niabella sp. CJ426]|uniref:hypothetical protein n=1 Tax=Niabella sp. CJ426 TaxID=3393740 RepID=UPI003D08D018